MADILITIQKDGKALVEGVSPKGIEWILQNLMHDRPTVYERLVPALRWSIEKENVIVEIYKKS